VSNDVIGSVNTKIRGVLEANGGILLKIENWGRRKLAYEVKKQLKGIYIFFRYLGSAGLVEEVERNLRLSDGVIKYQTVLVRSDVEVAAVTVVEDEVKFERLELPPAEDEPDDSRERQLGLIEPESRQERQEVVPDDEAEGPEAAPEEEEEA
jgi:small subunit ribosomal protein S6